MESASSASPGAAVGDDLAGEDRLGADVVGDRGQDRRVRRSGRARGARRPAARRRRLAQVGDGVHRVGRRAAVAEREQPCRRRRSARAAPRPPRTSASRPRRASARAARRPRRPSSRTDARDVGEHGVEVVLLLAEERIEEARRAGVVHRLARCGPRAARGARRRRARAPRARGRASRPAPGRRTGRRAAARTPTRRRRREARSSGSRALARRHGRRLAGVAGAEGDHDVVGLAPAARPRAGGRSPSAGSARLPTITGWTNSTATWRTSDASAADAPNASSRPPRAKRSAMRGTAARAARPRRAKKRSLASRARQQRRLDALEAGRGRRGHAGVPARSRQRARASRAHASTPSPVRALTQHARDAGVHRVEVVQEACPCRSRRARAGRSC